MQHTEYGRLRNYISWVGVCLMSDDVNFEQTTVSQGVLQMATDYLFVRQKLMAAGAVIVNDFGADLALSIVSDAYAHEEKKNLAQKQAEALEAMEALAAEEEVSDGD